MMCCCVAVSRRRCVMKAVLCRVGKGTSRRRDSAPIRMVQIDRDEGVRRGQGWAGGFKRPK